MSPRDTLSIECMAETDIVKYNSPHYKKKSDKQAKITNIERRLKTSCEGSCRACGEDRTSDYLCAKDFKVQSRNMELLSQTNWYFEGMTSQQAKSALAKTEIGTFLIRDSSDPNYLFSVSVKTQRGPTSVRVLYSDGRFQLDCDSKIRTVVPKFDTVVNLVDYYVRLGLNSRNKCRWLESSGRKDLPIELKKPKANAVCDLKHLCRLTINRSLPVLEKSSEVSSNIDKIGLPRPLADYLKDYPHLH